MKKIKRTQHDHEAAEIMTNLMAEFHNERVLEVMGRGELEEGLQVTYFDPRGSRPLDVRMRRAIPSSFVKGAMHFLISNHSEPIAMAAVKMDSDTGLPHIVKTGIFHDEFVTVFDGCAYLIGFSVLLTQINTLWGQEPTVLIGKDKLRQHIDTADKERTSEEDPYDLIHAFDPLELIPISEITDEEYERAVDATIEVSKSLTTEGVMVFHLVTSCPVGRERIKLVASPEVE